MEKKRKKRVNEILSHLTMTGGTVLLTILVLLGGAYYYGDLLELSHGCDGIELLFTNTSFENDFLNIFRISVDKTTSSLPVSPRNLLSGDSVDCDTISVAIGCLAKLYDNVECRYYSYKIFDNTGEDDVGHLGIKCRYIFNETIKGNWFIYY